MTLPNQPTRARVEEMVGLDAFVKALAVTVPGWLRAGNIWCFQYVMQNLKGDAPMIEIGSYAGLSAIALLYFKKKFGVRNPVFTCDRWLEQTPGAPDARLTEYTTVTNGALGEFVKTCFVRNVSFFSPDDLPASFQMTSDDFFEGWAKGETHTDVFGHNRQLGGTCSFGYIDGVHTYAFVKRDFEHMDRILEPGGFLLFDDSEPNSQEGPARVVEEVLASGRYELAHRAPNALVRKR